VLYAHLKHEGKFYKESLRTTDKATALDRYPAAMKRLRIKAAGAGRKPVVVIKPSDEAVVFDLQPDGSFTPRTTTAAELYEPDELSLSWEQATTLHAERQQERRGKPLAPSTLRAIRQSFSDLDVKPADVTTQDIRAYIKTLKERGFAATTISQRCSLLQGITQTLVKQDLLETNQWARVDFTAKGTSHYYEATPEDIKAILRGKDPVLLALVYTGCRVGELTSREARHLEEGWLTIEATDTWTPKTKDSVRSLPVPHHIAEQLQLPTPGKTSINSRLKGYNQKLSAHSLRHAYSTAIRESGIPFDLGQHLLGHAQPGGTIASTYGSFSPAAVEQATQKVWDVIDGW